MLSREDSELLDQYYVATIEDFCGGASVEMLELILSEYEKDENYIACAGINNALKELKLIIKNDDLRRDKD